MKYPSEMTDDEIRLEIATLREFSKPSTIEVARLDELEIEAGARAVAAAPPNSYVDVDPRSVAPRLRSVEELFRSPSVTIPLAEVVQALAMAHAHAPIWPAAPRPTDSEMRYALSGRLDALGDVARMLKIGDVFRAVTRGRLFKSEREVEAERTAVWHGEFIKLYREAVDMLHETESAPEKFHPTRADRLKARVEAIEVCARIVGVELPIALAWPIPREPGMPFAEVESVVAAFKPTIPGLAYTTRLQPWGKGKGTKLRVLIQGRLHIFPDEPAYCITSTFLGGWPSDSREVERSLLGSQEAFQSEIDRRLVEGGRP